MKAEIESMADRSEQVRLEGLAAGVRANRRGPGSGERQPAASGWRKLVLLPVASVCFALAILGVVLPGLPATPFLLITSYLLVRCSPRLNAALLRSRLFGPILADWQVHGGLRPHVKVKSIVLVIAMVALTICLSGYSLWLTLTVVSLATIGIVLIVRLPTAQGPVGAK
jgi:uncharacterized membrane protein YbaN (DUF454 family)